LKYHLKQAAQQTHSVQSSTPQVREVVENVIAQIRSQGDAAVREFSTKFDQWSPDSFRLSQQQIDAAIARLPEQTLADIRAAQVNVRRFAELQRPRSAISKAKYNPASSSARKISRSTRSAPTFPAADIRCWHRPT